MPYNESDMILPEDWNRPWPEALKQLRKRIVSVSSELSLPCVIWPGEVSSEDLWDLAAIVIRYGRISCSRVLCLKLCLPSRLDQLGETLAVDIAKRFGLYDAGVFGDVRLLCAFGPVVEEILERAEPALSPERRYELGQARRAAERVLSWMRTGGWPRAAR